MFSDFTERFIALWIVYSGLADEKEVNEDTSTVIKQIYLSGLKPDVAKNVQLCFPDITDSGDRFDLITREACMQKCERCKWEVKRLPRRRKGSRQFVEIIVRL